MVHLFFKELKSHWLEMVLAAMVISLAVSFSITQRAFSENAEAVIHDQAHRLGTNMLLVPEKMDMFGFYRFNYGEEMLPKDAEKTLRSSDIGQHIRISQARLYGNFDTAGISLVIVGMDDQVLGEKHTDGERSPAYIGHIAAADLKLNHGDEFSLNGRQLTATGILDNPPHGLDNGVFISLESAQSVLKKPGGINAMSLGGCWCRLNIPDLAARVEQLLPGTRAITKAGVIKAQTGILAAMEKFTLLFHTVFYLLTGGSVLVLILSQLRRYRKDIGLFLAVGMPPRIIVSLFLVKAAMTAAAGAAIGCMLAWPLTEKFSSAFLGTILRPDTGPSIRIGFICILISVLTASIASVKLMYMDPTRIMNEA